MSESSTLKDVVKDMLRDDDGGGGGEGLVIKDLPEVPAAGGGDYVQEEQKGESKVMVVGETKTKVMEIGDNSDPELTVMSADKKLKTLECEEVAEAEAATSSPKDKAVDNNDDKPSVLLEYLPQLRAAGVVDYLLEFVAAGLGGAQAVLNLRKVNSNTKEWVDDLTPSQSKKIFFRIPIHFELSPAEIEKFQDCPPPPSATAMSLKFEDDYAPDHISKEDKARLLQYKETHPKFFVFWKSRLQTLRMLFANFNAALLDLLDTPTALRNLDCPDDFGSVPVPLLFQLEILRMHPGGSSYKNRECYEKELSFYKQMVNNRNLKRMYTFLALQIFKNSDEEDDVDLEDEDFELIHLNPLEGIQILIDAKRSDPNFELVIEFEFDFDQTRHDKNSIPDRYLRSFVESVAASSSTIRIEDIPGKTIEDIFNLFSATEAETRRFRKFLKSYETITVTPFVMRFLKENAFPNLKWMQIEVSEDDEDDELELDFPKSLEFLTIKSDSFFLPRVTWEWPKQLKGLQLIVSEEQWTPNEWISFLTTISEGCPALKQLEISGARIKISKKALQDWIPPKETKYSFKNLRSLTLSLKFPKIKKMKEWGADKITRKILLDIFQVHKLSLLKLTLKCESEWVDYEDRRDAFKLEIDPPFVDLLLASPLAKTLLPYEEESDLLEYISDSSSKQKLLEVMTANDQQYYEKFGRLKNPDIEEYDNYYNYFNFQLYVSGCERI